MKTLDEVIDALERCSKPHYFDCNGCPYEDAEAETGCHPDDRDADVLHYLKEYRDKHEEMLQMEEALGYCEMSENRPLSWDELRTMEGKPVWATFDNENGTWYITKVYDDEVVLYEWGQEFGERISGAWNYTPERWQAYRKERS